MSSPGVAADEIDNLDERSILMVREARTAEILSASTS